MAVNYKTRLLCKENTIRINKCVIKELDIKINNIETETKKNIINIIIDNMKLVYKQIDTNKITVYNIDSMSAQYDKFVIEKTIKEINEKKILQSDTNIKTDSISDIKLNRDISINNKNALNNINNISNIIDRPINGRQTGDDSCIENKKPIDLSNYKINRNLELGNENIIPMMPDFLKPENTCVRKDNTQSEFTSSIAMPNQNNSTTVEFNTVDSQYCSIDDLFKPLINENEINQYKEDNVDVSFDDKLKQLQQSRNTDNTLDQINDKKK